MSVKLRLARIGKKHVPFFRIVAVDTRKKRDGQNLENLGTYDPIGHKLVQFNQDGIDAWIAKGAQMTDTVEKLQKMFEAHGLDTPFEAPKKAAPKKAAVAKPQEAPKAEVKADEKPADAPKAEEKPAKEAPKVEEKPVEAPKAEEKPADVPKEEAKEEAK